MRDFSSISTQMQTSGKARFLVALFNLIHSQRLKGGRNLKTKLAFQKANGFDGEESLPNHQEAGLLYVSTNWTVAARHRAI
jgi:hypothetical protein